MVQYEVFTNKGTREINEDRYGVAMHGDSYCFTVADGLGGHGNGEVAAQAAVDVICTTFVDEGYSDSFFQKAFSAAQDAILREQERLQAPSRMKTTAVVLVVHKGKAIWAHVGDSRLYSFKQGMMKTRTTDHSVPQMLAISGEIKEKDIRHHPDRNRLMRVMGIRGENPRYDVSPAMRLRGDNAFLLCTDGFWELVEDADMAQLQKESTSPEAWLIQMTQKIQENGKGSEMDNYTAIAVYAKETCVWGKWR